MRLYRETFGKFFCYDKDWGCIKFTKYQYPICADEPVGGYGVCSRHELTNCFNTCFIIRSERTLSMVDAGGGKWCIAATQQG